MQRVRRVPKERLEREEYKERQGILENVDPREPLVPPAMLELLVGQGNADQLVQRDPLVMMERKG